MKLAKVFLSVVLMSVVPLCTGCVHVATTAGSPARNATPLEKALAYNAGLAEGNKAIAQVVINANAQTPPLLSVDAANKLLSAQARVADFDRQLSPLLVDTATISANSSQIQTLLNEIKLAAQGVSGDLGIKDTATQTKVTNAVGEVLQMADLTLQSLVAGGLLK